MGISSVSNIAADQRAEKYSFLFLFDVVITNAYILLNFSGQSRISNPRILLRSIVVVAVEVVEGLSSTCFPFGTIPSG